MSLTKKPFAYLALSAIGISTVAGCGSTPPPRELVDARAAFNRAESGPAARFKPDALYEAKRALDRAERAYGESPKDAKTRDIAYVAERRAELANVEGLNAAAQRAKAEADKQI